MRTRAKLAALLASSLMIAGAPVITAPAFAAKKGKHCLKYKTYHKGKKSYKRCSKYSK
ncbi:MAG: hypothetical protein NVSMB25_13270 [Thermoleophilaceae bacterium]